MGFLRLSSYIIPQKKKEGIKLYSHKALRKLQISNPENSVGTAEAATEVLFHENISAMSHGDIDYQPIQDRGNLAKNIEVPYKVSQMVELAIEGDLYDRGAIFMLSNSVRGNVTAVSPGAPTPLQQNWPFEPTLTAPNTPDQTNGIDTFTLEWGNNIQAYEAAYLFTRMWEISGAPDELCKYKWEVTGNGVTETTFTPALSAPTTHQYFPFNKAKYFIDSNYAGIGGTQKTGFLKGFTATFEPMFTPRFTASGGYSYDALNEDRKTLQVELTFMRDSTHFEAELDKYLAKSISYQRIQLLGVTEMDSGQANPPYINIDMALRYIEWPELDEEDGNELITVTAEAVLDATSSKMFGVTVGSLMSAFA